MEQSRWLSALVGGPVWLKCENLQRTGSFKIRGAYVRISRLTPEERARGVVAASAGNHAQGVALAAQLLGIKSTVFMPEGAPIPKERATRAYGADVVFEGERARGVAGRGAAVRRGDRGGADPPVRPRRHRRGPGHPRSRGARAGARRADRAGADRRWRTAGRGRHRDQGAAPRRAGRGRAGGRRGGVPGLAGARVAGPARVDEDDGRRHRGRPARATSPSPRSATTSTRSAPSPRSRSRGPCWRWSSAPRWWSSPPGRPRSPRCWTDRTTSPDRSSRCSPAATSTRCCSAR